MASYNRYEGNTGRMRRVETPDNNAPPLAPVLPRPPAPVSPPKKPSLLDSLGGLLPKKLEGLETEDLLLLLVLYLMYRESGDKELLIIMGAMFLF